MSGRRIAALFALTFVVLMMGALVCKVLDFHDTRPFPIDPEFPAMVCCFLVALCFSVAATTACLFSFSFLYFCLKVFLRGFPQSALETWGIFRSFEIERLLFSPPLAFTSLRI